MTNSPDTAQRPAQPVVATGPWFAVYPCGWKLDIGNYTRETERPVALFQFRSSADEYARTRWPTTAEVRPIPMEFCSANTANHARSHNHENTK